MGVWTTEGGTVALGGVVASTSVEVILGASDVEVTVKSEAETITRE